MLEMSHQAQGVPAPPPPPGPVAPQAPQAPKAPQEPQAPVIPQAPQVPQVPQAPLGQPFVHLNWSILSQNFQANLMRMQKPICSAQMVG